MTKVIITGYIEIEPEIINGKMYFWVNDGKFIDLVVVENKRKASCIKIFLKYKKAIRIVGFYTTNIIDETIQKYAIAKSRTIKAQTIDILPQPFEFYEGE